MRYDISRDPREWANAQRRSPSLRNLKPPLGSRSKLLVSKSGSCHSCKNNDWLVAQSALSAVCLCLEVGFFCQAQRSARGCFSPSTSLSSRGLILHLRSSDPLVGPALTRRPASKGSAKGAMQGRHDRTGDSFECLASSHELPAWDFPAAKQDVEHVCPFAVKPRSLRASERGEPRALLARSHC